MTINRLLEELINIAKKSKTDFALYMNMSPSGLSKILTGKRLPSMKERKQFTGDAAAYFAEAIFSHGCYLKFENLFPVIYDFESVEELETFLSAAITYALDAAFAAENSLNLNYTDRGMYYLGRKPVLNQLCIVLSDYSVSLPDEPLELFVSLPLHCAAYARLFRKILLTGIKRSSKIVLNYYYDEAMITGPTGIGVGKLLALICELTKNFDLNFYKLEQMRDCFLLIKGKILMLFNSQLDADPLLAPVNHKRYLTIFFDNLMKKSTDKISYNKTEALHYFEENPGFIPDLIDAGVESSYNFLSIGYLLERQELSAMGGDSAMGDSISALFGGILAKSTTFVLSAASLDRFAVSGRLIAPLIGTAVFTPKQRLDYMKRLRNLLTEDSTQSLKITDCEISDISVLLAGGVCLIYTLDESCGQEKIHAFRSEALCAQMNNEMHNPDFMLVDFSEELWDTFQDKLIGSVEDTI